MNRAGLEMIQADSLEQVKGTCVYPLVSDEHREAFKALNRDVFKGRSGTLEFRLTGMKGRSFWQYCHAVPLRNEKGEIVAMLATSVDITNRKQAEEALKTREKQLAESQRIGHIGSWEHNVTTGKVFWSDELFRILGLDPEKDPADFQMFFRMIHPDDQDILKKAIDETVRLKKPFSVDYRFMPRDGSVRILHAQAELMHDDSGAQVILGGTVQDFTERMEAGEKLRRSEEFIRSILDTVDEGFIVVDRDYRILTANTAYCKQVGERNEDIIGSHCYAISHRIHRPCFEVGEACAVRQVFATGEPHTALHKHPDKDGNILFVETKAYPVKDDSGNVICDRDGQQHLGEAPPRGGAAEDPEARIYRDTRRRDRPRFQQPPSRSLWIYFDGENVPRPEGEGP
jgi:PAS domain S-box-containing protein